MWPGEAAGRRRSRQLVRLTVGLRAVGGGRWAAERGWWAVGGGVRAEGSGVRMTRRIQATLEVTWSKTTMTMKGWQRRDSY